MPPEKVFAVRDNASVRLVGKESIAVRLTAPLAMIVVETDVARVLLALTSVLATQASLAHTAKALYFLPAIMAFLMGKNLPLPFSLSRQFLGPQYWPADELYGDFHPVFNRSVIASVHIRMPAESLELLRSPSFLYQNATYLKADMVFTNGHVKLDLPNIGIKCKG